MTLVNGQSRITKWSHGDIFDTKYIADDVQHPLHNEALKTWTMGESLYHQVMIEDIVDNGIVYIKSISKLGVDVQFLIIVIW